MTQSTGRPVAIVTGGGTGMGRSVAIDLAKDHDVVIVGRRKERLEEVADLAGMAVTPIAADVSDVDAVEALVGSVMRLHKRIDVLVNCVGVRAARVLTTTDLRAAAEVWTGQLKANATSHFLMCYAVAKHMTRPGGRIVNFSSEGVYTGGIRPGNPAYIAAKGAVQAMTLCLARELSPEGITVNVVVPGIIGDTDMSSQLTDEGRADYAAETIVGRIGRPEEVAAGVRYLVSPEAGFVTGQMLTINGGAVLGR